MSDEEGGEVGMMTDPPAQIVNSDQADFDAALDVALAGLVGGLVDSAGRGGLIEIETETERQKFVDPYNLARAAEVLQRIGGMPVRKNPTALHPVRTRYRRGR